MSIIFRARIDDCANALLHIFNDGTCIVQLFDLLFFCRLPIDASGCRNYIIP